MPTKISDLTLQVNIADDDVLHVRTAGGIDHRITGYNARKELSRKIVQVTTKTALSVGDPVAYSGGKYGKYKLEQLQASTQILATASAIDRQSGVCVVKDYQTGEIGVVVMYDDSMRLFKINSDGNGITFLTAEINPWTTNPPGNLALAPNYNFSYILAMPGGRYRFIVFWATSGPVFRARVGEWDGASGISWLTAETTITPSSGTPTNFHLLLNEDDPQYVALLYTDTTGPALRGIILQFSGGVLSTYVADTAIQTGAAVCAFYGSSWMGDGYFGVTWHASNTSSALTIVRLTSAPALTLIKHQQIVAASWGIRYMHGARRLGPKGSRWNIVVPTPAAATRTDYSGDWNAGGEIDIYPGSATYTKSQSQKNVSPAQQGICQDLEGYLLMAMGYTIGGDQSGIEVWRYRDSDGFATNLLNSTLIDTTGTALKGMDMNYGVAAMMISKGASATGPHNIELWRVPRCRGVSLDSAVADDVVRVLISGADDSISVLGNGEQAEWDPVSGLLLPGRGGFDVRLKSLPDGGVMVEQT